MASDGVPTVVFFGDNILGATLVLQAVSDVVVLVSILARKCASSGRLKDVALAVVKHLGLRSHASLPVFVGLHVTWVAR
jgi:hypothetical protein